MHMVYHHLPHLCDGAERAYPVFPHEAILFPHGAHHRIVLKKRNIEYGLYIYTYL